jgi:hypothetical protein
MLIAAVLPARVWVAAAAAIERKWVVTLACGMLVGVEWHVWIRPRLKTASCRLQQPATQNSLAQQWQRLRALDAPGVAEHGAWIAAIDMVKLSVLAALVGLPVLVWNVRFVTAFFFVPQGLFTLFLLWAATYTFLATLVPLLIKTSRAALWRASTFAVLWGAFALHALLARLLWIAIFTS